jgi:hypothetical protein
MVSQSYGSYICNIGFFALRYISGVIWCIPCMVCHSGAQNGPKMLIPKRDRNRIAGKLRKSLVHKFLDVEWSFEKTEDGLFVTCLYCEHEPYTIFHAWDRIMYGEGRRLFSFVINFWSMQLFYIRRSSPFPATSISARLEIGFG